MSDRKSPHAKMLDFFDTAPLSEAELMFGLIRDKVKARQARSTAGSTKAPAKKGGLSPAARKRIADAQKKRWETKRKEDQAAPSVPGNVAEQEALV